MKLVATHQKPDADALVSAWLASRYLFDDRRVDVVFVGRGCSINKLANYDCVVDLSGVHDPERLIFDHKPPAFSDRNETCATRLVWEHLLSFERPIEHFAPLVDLVHEGDSNPPRSPSAALANSRKDGLHAAVRQARAGLNTDLEMFRDVSRWLANFDRTARKTARQPSESV